MRTLPFIDEERRWRKSSTKRGGGGGTNAGRLPSSCCSLSAAATRWNCSIFFPGKLCFLLKFHFFSPRRSLVVVESFCTLWKDEDLSKCFVFMSVEQHIWRFRWLISLNEKESKTHSSKNNRKAPVAMLSVLSSLHGSTAKTIHFFLIYLKKTNNNNKKNTKRSSVCSRRIMTAAGRRWPAALGRSLLITKNKLPPLSRRLSTEATPVAPWPELIQFQSWCLHKQLCGQFLVFFSQNELLKVLTVYSTTLLHYCCAKFLAFRCV